MRRWPLPGQGNGGGARPESGEGRQSSTLETFKWGRRRIGGSSVHLAWWRAHGKKENGRGAAPVASCRSREKNRGGMGPAQQRAKEEEEGCSGTRGAGVPGETWQRRRQARI
jgi:hypothetical protein